jgi:Co/Zn/Cd efflux system component
MQRSHFLASHGTAARAHKYGVIDPKMMASERGKQAVKWSFMLLMFTALRQMMVIFMSGSVALLADTLHNFGDAVANQRNGLLMDGVESRILPAL